MVQNNKKKKTPTQRLSPQSGIGHHAHGAPDNPNNKDQETSPDKDNPKDGINPNPTSSQLTTENIVNEPNQLIEERIVMGLHTSHTMGGGTAQSARGATCPGRTQRLWTESYLRDRSA